MIDTIISRFLDLAGAKWEPTEPQYQTLSRLVDYAGNNGIRISDDFEGAFFEAINQKLAINAAVFQHILDVAFTEGVKLNYLQKTKIRSCLDRRDFEAYAALLLDNAGVTEKMANAFTPASAEATLQAFHRAGETDKQFPEMLCAIFSRYCFNLFPRECTSLFFSDQSQFSEEYFDFIANIYPDMVSRDAALSIIDVSEEIFENGYAYGCSVLCDTIKESFGCLNNHCDLAIYLPDLTIEGHSIQWELFSDLILYAEKMNPETIDRAYFRWKKIKSITEAYIPALEGADTAFELAFQGFVFKDCFVLGQGSSYSILLILEKNIRDERPLFCPACRSLNIEGNSYPILNVRSWECRNPLCPDRSKYNRGKRYAFMSIMRQKLMADESNRIPEASIAAWRLDCVFNFGKEQAFEMVIRHYSCVEDGVIIYASRGEEMPPELLHGRSASYHRFKLPDKNTIGDFKRSAYFTRYLQEDPRPWKPQPMWKFDDSVVYHGDSFEVLKGLPSDSVDGAVTSPPYYNAKEYAQWENIYCYLYDMYNISKEIYRVLKPGSVYLFNIFDYFDNEKNIVFSAMGNKRMILGAYMLDIFRRIGFTVQGNIIWYKGEIQGNRSFNQGNLTPYYQAPLNCWEHVFILSKGTPQDRFRSIASSIASIRPVIKMVRGKNTLGHTAPYPEEIPNLLLEHMQPGDTVLDPFLGSGTTTIAANKLGINAIGIERSKEYFELCKRLISENTIRQFSLPNQYPKG